jgi:hypothetical protein
MGRAGGAVPDGRGDERHINRARVDVDVDLSASEVFSNPQFGAMGIAVARKGDWGFARGVSPSS